MFPVQSSSLALTVMRLGAVFAPPPKKGGGSKFEQAKAALQLARDEVFLSWTSALTSQSLVFSAHLPTLVGFGWSPLVEAR